MHLRFARAAVAAGDSRPEQAHPPEPRPDNHSGPTLWATRPLAVRDGRLVAVRLRGGRIEVRFVTAATGLAAWLPAQMVLTPSQEAVWVGTSQFRRS